MTCENTTPYDMRELFLKAIELQRSNIDDAERRITHYQWALAEMDKENNIIET